MIAKSVHDCFVMYVREVECIDGSYIEMNEVVVFVLPCSCRRLFYRARGCAEGVPLLRKESEKLGFVGPTLLYVLAETANIQDTLFDKMCACSVDRIYVGTYVV